MFGAWVCIHTHTYIYIHTQIHIYMDFPGAKKNPIAKARNSQRGGFDPWVGEIPRSRRSPGGGHGNPLQCSCLENPIDRGAWQAIVHGVAKSQAWLSNYHSLPLIRQELHSLTRPNYSSSLGCKARVGEWNRNVEKELEIWKLLPRESRLVTPQEAHWGSYFAPDRPMQQQSLPGDIFTSACRGPLSRHLAGSDTKQTFLVT